jgi:uncharacterized protein (TIGR01777 family)
MNLPKSLWWAWAGGTYITTNTSNAASANNLLNVHLLTLLRTLPEKLSEVNPVAVIGSTGMLGRHLCRELRVRGYTVTAFVRNPHQAKLPDVSHILPMRFDVPTAFKALNRAKAVINVAGAPIIGKRLTPAYLQTVRDSRIGLTRRLVRALGDLPEPPLLINASATGFYGTHELSDIAVDETSPSPRGEFWADLTREWEEAAYANARVRAACIRTGIVLGPEPGGTLAKLALPFRMFVGGPLGLSHAWRSWIHIDDEIGIFLHALEHTLSGPLNATAPLPLQNADFAAALGHHLHRPNWCTTPEWPVKLLFGEAGEVITRGRKILPTVTMASGYTFKYPDLATALEDLLPD